MHSQFVPSRAVHVANTKRLGVPDACWIVAATVPKSAGGRDFGDEKPSGLATALHLCSPMSVPYRHYAPGLLVAFYTINFLDRQIVTILISDIKRDLNLSDSEVGARAGL